MKRNILISLEGPDMTGKSEIAQELSRILGISYFKNKNEWHSDLDDPTYFKNLLVYGGPFFVDFLSQAKPSAILDRYYPSEWVYSRFFNRETDNDIICKIDEKFAEAGGKIIICRRKSYKGIRDDIHSYVDSSILEGLDKLYSEFSEWTKCEVMTLWVDDENLEREISEIKEWLNNVGV